jgi:hypothetical protein
MLMFSISNESAKSALVHSLFRFWSHDNLPSASIALSIYRRSVSLSTKSMQWLAHCLKINNMISQPMALIDEPTIIFELTNVDKSDSFSQPGTDSHWNKVLPSLNGVLFNSTICPYLQQIVQEKNPTNKQSLKEDEFYLIVGANKILAHKSIVAAKSGKLAGAIRFNESQLESNNDPVSIRLDLPLATAKMLLTHIYNGSIMFGLKSAPELQCQQLLELALLAEEHSCPTLILECEMRLLKYGSRECICRNCLVEMGGLESDGDSGRYLYKIVGGSFSGLITPQTALDVLAVAQQLEESSCAYETKYHTRSMTGISRSPLHENKVTVPFVAAKIAAVAVILRHFKATCASDSFLHQTRCATTEIIDCSLEPPSPASVDENSMMLLSLCLEEFRQNKLLIQRQNEASLSGINHDLMFSAYSPRD